ncbi:MAG TPA: nitrilase-related carbon-nitrogen hydrolase [Trueperaceae bacterium]
MHWAALSGFVLMLCARGILPGLVACIALIPLCHALRLARTPLQAGRWTFIAQVGLLLTAFEGAAPAIPWSFPLLILLAAPSAMLPGFLHHLLAKEWKGRPTLWLLPFLWTASEFIASRREIWGQLASPVALGYTQFDGPLMLLASIGGMSAVTLAVLVVNVGVYRAVLSRRYSRLLLPLALVIACTIPRFTTEEVDQAPKATIGIVQPALESSWYELAGELDRAQAVIEGRLSTLGQEVMEADLIVWPEGALPAGPVPALSSGFGTYAFDRPDLLSGAISTRDGKRYNSVVRVSGRSAVAVFDKLAPVPIGESAFSPGTRLTVGHWGGIWSAPLICLDSLYPQFARRLALQGAEALLVLSDDSFARQTITPRLHLRTSAFRAVETGLPLVFVSAHGPSALIGPHGQVLAATEYGKAEALLAQVPRNGATTLYVRFGEWIGYFSTFLTLSLVMVQLLHRRRW